MVNKHALLNKKIGGGHTFMNKEFRRAIYAGSSLEVISQQRFQKKMSLFSKNKEINVLKVRKHKKTILEIPPRNGSH